MIQKNGRWILTEKDIKIGENDIDADICDRELYITAAIETWFDVDLRFGTNTRGKDHYVNFYATYYPEKDELTLSYVIHYPSDDERYCSEETEPEYFDSQEKELILRLMKKAGMVKLIEEMKES